MLIDIYMKFREDSSNSFQVIERTRFCDRQTPRGKTISSPYPKAGRHNYVSRDVNRLKELNFEP